MSQVNGLTGNKMADAAAKSAAEMFTNEEQDQVCATLNTHKLEKLPKAEIASELDATTNC
jgi:hypothetical protein